MPTVLIQPTHCLLYAAAAQAIAADHPGFHDLDSVEDRWILNCAVQQLNAALDHPDISYRTSQLEDLR